MLLRKPILENGVHAVAVDLWRTFAKKPRKASLTQGFADARGFVQLKRVENSLLLTSQGKYTIVDLEDAAQQNSHWPLVFKLQKGFDPLNLDSQRPEREYFAEPGAIILGIGPIPRRGASARLEKTDLRVVKKSRPR
jgi:hypothetical protein